ncbi:T9SS type A sorting domain-containing protein [Flavobacterium sp. H122]|uniref:T9SS type A sorting domain-containing protein n=1 Tax=Flavobacterium sp. H122 TaxID=2529860 RepID=UPI00145B14F8|nr:T9SS type A sorting domain-containing protein [Flavobacterium sp. H122]
MKKLFFCFVLFLSGCAFSQMLTAKALTNPIIPYDESSTPVICPDNGERLPYIFLCGSTDTQLLQTNISDAVSVQWFLYNEGSCGAYPLNSCPITTDSCWTNLVGTGSNYTVAQAGKYRVVFTFAGGSYSTFYFNVYQSLLNPQVIAKNIICGNPGAITVDNVPNSGYQFQLLNGPTVVFPWQSSNIFDSINTAGNYTVQARPTAFSGGCVFSVSNIEIQIQDITVTAQVTQPLCYGEFGEVSLGVTGVSGQYYFILHQGATIASPIVGSAGPTDLTNYVFSNLNPGETYTWETRTDDGCIRSGTFAVNNPTQLIVNSLITLPVNTNNSGVITVNASGGMPPYQYSMDNILFSSQNVFTGLPPGSYNIYTRDSNGCLNTTNQVLNPITPVIDNPTQTFPQGATLADIQVTGQNIKWYATQSGYKRASSELPLSTVLVDGTTYYVSQTVNGVESEKTGITVNVGALSNDGFTFQNLKVYPVPVKEILTVNNTAVIKKAVIFNYLGSEVLSQSVDKTNFEINLSTLDKGVYFVKLESQDTQKTIKFIKE